jgi:signal transduction histidine kinase/CheY-like chemotaxis protein
VCLGAAAFAMLVATHRIGERHVGHYAPLQRAVADLQLSIVASHLWLEEFLTGDASVVLDRDVWGELDRAERLTGALLDGGSVDEGRSRLEALGEEGLRRRALRIRRLLESFRTLAHTRVGRSASAGVGSRLDVRYDEVSRQLLAEAHLLALGVERRMAEGRRRSSLLVGSILLAWLLLIGTALLALRRRLRLQRDAETALRRSEEQLRQAQKLDAVGRLAGGLAHDVNNYLATINAQVGLVKVLHGDQPGIASMMDEVVSTVGRTSSLIQRLLAFSRSQPSRPEVMDLNALTREMGSMMGRLLSDDVELELRLGRDPWHVEVDPTQIEQVLVNLLVNAREAMPGGGRVTVTTANVVADAAEAPEAAPGEYVMLAVGDEGLGIPAAVRERIFEPFFTTKRLPGGEAGGGEHSGLGLATAYGIVHQAGGFLRLESEEGSGTTFRVYLPRSRGKAAAPPSAAAEAASRPSRPRYRVLVVEDNPELRQAADAILTAVGQEVTAAADGDAGARCISEAAEPFDVVVTDLVMPGRNGHEVAEAALASGCRGVVLVSGFRERVGVEDLLADPRVRCLDKPFDPEALLATLDELMERSAAVERSA